MHSQNGDVQGQFSISWNLINQITEQAHTTSAALKSILGYY